jgi:hypothetical protein
VRLAIRFLGLDLLDIELSTETPDAEEDLARDLSGGELGSNVLEVGSTDRYMGFTNGRDDE